MLGGFRAAWPPAPAAPAGPGARIGRPARSAGGDVRHCHCAIARRRACELIWRPHDHACSVAFWRHGRPPLLHQPAREPEQARPHAAQEWTCGTDLVLVHAGGPVSSSGGRTTLLARWLSGGMAFRPAAPAGPGARTGPPARSAGVNARHGLCTRACRKGFELIWRPHSRACSVAFARHGLPPCGTSRPGSLNRPARTQRRSERAARPLYSCMQEGL